LKNANSSYFMILDWWGEHPREPERDSSMARQEPRSTRISSGNFS
jgi:hypothetical protein